MLACAGLKRTGKSCRLRWLNYLRPDVRRGNITLQEQLLILQLHSRWGNRYFLYTYICSCCTSYTALLSVDWLCFNLCFYCMKHSRWSKIAQHLPGRTDNEIKNYWRTRVQKQAKQLKCDVNSKQFRDTMRYVWIPRLIERIQSESESSMGQPTTTTTYSSSCITNQMDVPASESEPEWVDPNFLPELSDSFDTQVSPASDLTDCQNLPSGYCSDSMQNGSGLYPENNCSSWGWQKQGVDMQAMEQQGNSLLGVGDSLEDFWNEENVWIVQQQLMM